MIQGLAFGIMWITIGKPTENRGLTGFDGIYPLVMTNIADIAIEDDPLIS